MDMENFNPEEAYQRPYDKTGHKYDFGSEKKEADYDDLEITAKENLPFNKRLSQRRPK